MTSQHDALDSSALLAALAAKDEAAWRVLVDRHQGMFYGLANGHPR